MISYLQRLWLCPERGSKESGSSPKSPPYRASRQPGPGPTDAVIQSLFEDRDPLQNKSPLRSLSGVGRAATSLCSLGSRNSLTAQSPSRQGLGCSCRDCSALASSDAQNQTKSTTDWKHAPLPPTCSPVFMPLLASEYQLQEPLASRRVGSPAPRYGWITSCLQRPRPKAGTFTGRPMALLGVAQLKHLASRSVPRPHPITSM